MSSRSLNLPDALHDYVLSVGVREDPALVALREETATLEDAGMQISPEHGAFLQMLIRLTGARRVLEVGTFTGYSALAMALALPEGGGVTCCDVSEAWTTIARRHWDAAGVGDRITLHLGPALETLEKLVAGGETYDLAFVDADKANYLAYHEQCLRLVRPGGAILFDNVLWGGSVADPANQKASTQAIRALNAALHADERVDVSLVPIGDGVTIARRR